MNISSNLLVSEPAYALNRRIIWIFVCCNRRMLWTGGSLNQRMLWTDGSLIRCMLCTGVCSEPVYALNRCMLWTGVCSEPVCALNRRMLWTDASLNQRMLWTDVCSEPAYSLNRCMLWTAWRFCGKFVSHFSTHVGALNTRHYENWHQMAQILCHLATFCDIVLTFCDIFLTFWCHCFDILMSLFWHFDVIVLARKYNDMTYFWPLAFKCHCFDILMSFCWHVNISLWHILATWWLNAYIKSDFKEVMSFKRKDE